MPTKLIIEAFDNLFFGTGRPFTMGNDSWATAIFPPMPNTLYGMLRALYFKSNMNDYKNVDTDTDPTLNIEILNHGLELVDENDATVQLFPLPLDFVFNHNNNKYELLLLKKIDTTVISNANPKLTHRLIGNTTDKIRSRKEGYYIRKDLMQEYLAGKLTSIDEENVIKLDKYLTKESKIGIKRNRYDTEDKELYRIQFTRPENTKGSRIRFWIVFNGVNLPNHSISRMGGEGKLVSVIKENIEENSIRSPFLRKKSIVKLYLETPAIFSSGSNPDIQGAELIAGVIGNVKYVGGWDIEKRMPKPTNIVVPAGSVFYYQVSNINNFKHVKDTLLIGKDNKNGFGRIKLIETKYNK